MLECKPVTAPDTRTLLQGSKATDAAKCDPAHGQPYCSPYQETCIPRESNHELPRRGSTCSYREEPQAMQASEPVQRAVFPVRPLKEAAGARVQHDLSQIDRRPAPAIRLDNLSSPSRYHLRLVTISVSSPSQSRHRTSPATMTTRKATRNSTSSGSHVEVLPQYPRHHRNSPASLTLRSPS